MTETRHRAKSSTRPAGQSETSVPLPTRRRLIAGLLAGAATAGATRAQPAFGAASGFPNRPLRFVVSSPPGGASDTSARLIAARLGQRLGQPVVAENRPGAAGNIATSAVVRGPADGYQLLLGASFLTVNPWLYKNAGYDPVRDLAPLGRPIYKRVVLVGRPDLPAFANLLEQAKRTNAPIRVASPGAGTLSHLAGEVLRLRTGAPMIHVPYRGSVAALTDLAGQQVDVMFDAVASAMPMIKGGRIKAVAVPETARNPQLPEVPTLAELGVPGIVIQAWDAMFAPAATPPEVLETLRAHLEAVLATPEVADELRSRGLEVGEPTTPQAFIARLQAETELWRRTAEAAGVTAD